jgi:transposase
MTKSAIARLLGVHRHTVQKYSALEFAPERQPRVRKVSALAPYENYILDASRTNAPTRPRSTRRSSNKVILACTTTFGASSST